MLLLAVDTATEFCSVCLYDSRDDGVVARSTEDVGRRHAECLLPMIEDALAQSGRTYSAIDRLAVCIGPGSFTGLRVGVAAMRGFALALDVPLVGVSVFDVLVQSTDPTQPVLVVLDARRGEVYGQLFATDRQPVTAAAVLTPQQAADIARRHAAALIGSGGLLVADRDAALPVIDEARLDIACLAELAAKREPENYPPVPLYLRAPDAKPQTGFALPRRREAS